MNLFLLLLGLSAAPLSAHAAEPKLEDYIGKWELVTYTKGYKRWCEDTIQVSRNARDSQTLVFDYILDDGLADDPPCGRNFYLCMGVGRWEADDHRATGLMKRVTTFSRGKLKRVEYFTEHLIWPKITRRYKNLHTIYVKTMPEHSPKPLLVYESDGSFRNDEFRCRWKRAD